MYRAGDDIHGFRGRADFQREIERNVLVDVQLDSFAPYSLEVWRIDSYGVGARRDLAQHEPARLVDRGRVSEALFHIC